VKSAVSSLLPEPSIKPFAGHFPSSFACLRFCKSFTGLLSVRYTTHPKMLGDGRNRGLHPWITSSDSVWRKPGCSAGSPVVHKLTREGSESSRVLLRFSRLCHFVMLMSHMCPGARLHMTEGIILANRDLRSRSSV
jgi:hypothetical protein